MVELGWLNSANATQLLSQLSSQAKRYSVDIQSEADTIAIIVEPILRGLAWDTLLLEDVSRESRRKCPLGDLWLRCAAEAGARIAVMFEVKQMGQPHVEESDRSQLRRYVDRLFKARQNSSHDPEKNWQWCLRCGSSVFVRSVLTNGLEWEIYDLKEKADPTSLYLSSKFLLSDVEKARTELLRLLSKQRVYIEVNEFLSRQS